LGLVQEHEDSLDFTWGSCSIHFHKHGGLLYPIEPTEEQKKLLKREFKRFWAKAAAKRGRKVSKQVGVVLRELNFNEESIEDYIAKTGLKQQSEAKEIAHRTKKSNGGYGLREIQEAVAAGSRVWTARFRELEDWFHGKRVHNRSRGLSKLLKTLKSSEQNEPEQYEIVFTMKSEVFKQVERTDLLRRLLRVACMDQSRSQRFQMVLEVGDYLRQERLSVLDFHDIRRILIRYEQAELPPPLKKANVSGKIV
jgi:hypothetical protein